MVARSVTTVMVGTSVSVPPDSIVSLVNVPVSQLGQFTEGEE